MLLVRLLTISAGREFQCDITLIKSVYEHVWGHRLWFKENLVVRMTGGRGGVKVEEDDGMQERL